MSLLITETASDVPKVYPLNTQLELTGDGGFPAGPGENIHSKHDKREALHPGQSGTDETIDYMNRRCSACDQGLPKTSDEHTRIGTCKYTYKDFRRWASCKACLGHKSVNDPSHTLPRHPAGSECTSHVTSTGPGLHLSCTFAHLPVVRVK